MTEQEFLNKVNSGELFDKGELKNLLLKTVGK